MIKLGNQNITLKLGSANVSAAYLGSVQVYGGTPTYNICYGVTDDIATYSARTFTDVYDKSTDKWYKLNNLNQYEEYGVYGSGRNITTYNGKLTIDNGYEYQYSGDSWVNVGEISGDSRVPNTYDELEYIGNSSSGTNYYIDSGFKPNQNTRMVVVATPQTITNNPRMFGTGPFDNLAFVGNIESTNPPKFYFKFGQTSSWYTTSAEAVAGVKHTFDLSKNGYYIDGTLVGTPTESTFQLTTNIGLFNAPAVSKFANSETFIGLIHSSQIYDDGTLIRDYIPVRRKSDNKIGMYDAVNNTFTTAVNTSYNFAAGSTITGNTYPIYYDEKTDPVDNLTFSTLSDADEYAYTNCVYDGMKATINGDKYMFDSTNGWTAITGDTYTTILGVERANDYIGHVDLGVQIKTNNFKIELDHRYKSPNGGRFLWSSDSLRFFKTYSATYFDYNGQRINGGGSTNFPTITRYTITLENYKMINNNNLYEVSGVTQTQAPPEANLRLFSNNVEVVSDRGTVYGVKVWDDGVLIGDFIPVKRDSDDVITMYNLVTNTFCEVSGTLKEATD